MGAMRVTIRMTVRAKMTVTMTIKVTMSVSMSVTHSGFFEGRSAINMIIPTDPRAGFSLA